LEGVLVSEKQIDADVGAGLPSPIGEEPAVLEEGLVAPGLDVQRGNPARPAYKGLTKGSRGLPDSPRNIPVSTWPSSLFSRVG
jgi:hypothetical protein